MISKWTRAISVALLSALFVAEASALPDETQIWVSLRGSLHVFSGRDLGDLEALAFEYSNPYQDRPIDFGSKPWEITFGVRLGFVLNPAWSIQFVYEREPYLLDADAAQLQIRDLTDPRSDTIRLEAGANLLGFGLDYALLSGYSNTIRVGVVSGLLTMAGNDQDVTGSQNFKLSGESYFADLYIGIDYEFNDELSFHPYAQYRYGRVKDPAVLDVRFPLETFDDSFSFDYSGYQLGIELRVKAYPFGVPGG
ncbi:MAG TPA: hypothetical protein VGB13_01705 [Candidatus Krumholzibacteria bacterium]